MKIELTKPPKWIRFKSDESEITLAADPLPTLWHKKNLLYIYTYTKAQVYNGSEIMFGMAQINQMIRRDMIEYKL